MLKYTHAPGAVVSRFGSSETGSVGRTMVRVPPRFWASAGRGGGQRARGRWRRRRSTSRGVSGIASSDLSLWGRRRPSSSAASSAATSRACTRTVALAPERGERELGRSARRPCRAARARAAGRRAAGCRRPGRGRSDRRRCKSSGTSTRDSRIGAALAAAVSPPSPAARRASPGAAASRRRPGRARRPPAVRGPCGRPPPPGDLAARASHRARGAGRPQRQHGRIAEPQRGGQIDLGVRARARRRRACRWCPRACATTRGSRTCPTSRSMARPKLRVLRRELGHGHEGAGQPDAPERLIARTREMPRPALLAGHVRHHRLGEICRVLGGVEDGVVGRAPRARGIHVEVQDARDAARARRGPRTTPSPRSARASGRTRRPGACPGGARRDAGREQPRHLQHGRVGAAVVHGAVMPGVHVAGKEGEGLLGLPRGAR